MQKKRIRIADLKKGQRGFSLIELMIVIVILGLLASMLVPKIMDRPNEARVTKAKMDMKALDSALKLYKLDTGRYPTTEQGLQALITKPDTRPVPRNYRKGGYLDSASAPVDPWGYDYIYRSPGEDGRPYELISLGADGMEGGEDYDADIKELGINGFGKYMNMHAARRYSGGLTFIELLIVLFIVGMGWFTLMPNLDLAGDKGDDSISTVNALIYEAKTEAVINDSRQYVYVDFENGLVKWNGEEAKLPSAVSSGHFNEYPADGGVEFTIYPEGFSDEVRLVLSDGVTVVLDPLSVRFGEM